jgi:2-alkyl-3-oxoalkanoate reductase
MMQMRIFVTGATGVIGRRAVPLLLEQGHQVTAVGRSVDRLRPLARLGAAPLQAERFDRAALARAMAGHDAVVNLATHIPTGSVRPFLPGAWAANDRIRRDGSAALVDAAQDAGVERFVQESFAPIYADAGDRWIDETAPRQPARYNRTVMDAEASAARFRGVGIALRFAYFYGPGDAFTLQILQLARKGWLPLPGRADGFFSMVHQGDAAAAVAAALRAPAGIYNVVEDQPLTRRQLADALGEIVGRGSPRLPPGWVARIGGSLVETLARSLRISNRKLRDTTGWAPRYPSSGQGLMAAARGE